MLHLHNVVVYRIVLTVMMLRNLAFGFRGVVNLQSSRCTIQTSTSCHRSRLMSSLSAAKDPTVEVSPSDHGTTPLSKFTSSSVLDKRLVKTLQSSALNITIPTPIQSHALPLLFNSYDIMASSATGSGKTLMFGLPLLNQLLLTVERQPRNQQNLGLPTALIISPTRELAVQTCDVLNNFKTNINICLATGGSDSRIQRKALPNCNVLVGTPGRICQFLDERNLSLQSVNYLVIDEADRLLDMGFEKDLTRISRSFSRRNEKQSVLCSATFPQGVQRLASDFLQPNYYFVSAGKVGSTHSTIKQRFEWLDIYSGGRNNNRHGNNNPKVQSVVKNVQQFWDSKPKKDESSVLVFSNTKDGAESYGKALANKLKCRSVRVIHGDKLQSERNRAIQDFKSGKVTCLVATDVAARGLDVSSIGFVLQADAPRDVDTYTHRIGRTGRAGRSGETMTILDSKVGLELPRVLLICCKAPTRTTSPRGYKARLILPMLGLWKRKCRYRLVQQVLKIMAMRWNQK